MSGSRIPKSQNGSHYLSCVPGPSRPSGSTGTTQSMKRSCDYNEVFEQTFKISKQSNDTKSLGPAYQRTNDSIVLYDPPVHEKYHAVKNPTGYVEVIVHPELQNGKKENEECPLKPEQIEGLKFLWQAFSTKKGVILGHEMGLGKTRTTIAFMYTLLEQSERSPGKSKPGANKIIILAPKNAIATWEEELEIWRPKGLKVNHKAIYYIINDAENVDIIKNFGKKRSNLQILILSYESFKKYKNLFYDYKMPVDVVVCDEAHILKNNLTARSQFIKGVESKGQKELKAKLWIGLTGTPFQNNLEEFCNLLHFFQPGVLGANYKQTFCRPIENHLKKYKQLNKETKKFFNTLKKTALNVVQYKNNIIDVDKHNIVVCVGLRGKNKETMEEMKIQNKLYEALATHFDTMSDEDDPSINFYQKLDMLKKLCIHPEYAFKSIQKHHRLEDVANMYVENYNTAKTQPNFSKELYWLLFSGKLLLLFNMLKDIKETSPDEKAIVVSYSTEILDYIFKICKSEVAERLGFNALKILRYEGGTPDAERSRVLKKFEKNDDIFLLLLSGKAGGTALNLTRANHMFLLDPDWNPSNDKQALARIYRPGQTRTVYSYRFLSTGTIEESIFLLQLSKEEIYEFLKAKENNKTLHLPFSEKDLLVFHHKTKSHLRDKLRQLCCQTFMENRETIESTGYGNMEMQYFAQELSLAKNYYNEASIPEELGILKRSWKQGITFAFHISKLYMPFDTADEGFYSLLNSDPLEVRVVKPKKSKLMKNDPQMYTIRSIPKGLVFVINLKNYLICYDGTPVDHPDDSDMQRIGSEHDVRYMQYLFNQMGYKVIIKEDLFDRESLSYQLEEFKRTLKRYKPDSAYIFLMGHGTNEGLQMINGDIVNVWTDIICGFSNDSFFEMKGKPKTFVFNSCQDFVSCGLPNVRMAMDPTDIIVCTAATPGGPAQRWEPIGSFYIYKLVEILMKNSWKNDMIQMLDQLRIEMTKISTNKRNEDDTYIQVPNYSSFLTKKLYLH